MIDVLLETKNAVAYAPVADGRDALQPFNRCLTDLKDRYRHAALCGISANPYPGSGPRSKARALAERLRDRTDGYQRYMTDFMFPFDNNAAERDLRSEWSRLSWSPATDVATHEVPTEFSGAAVAIAIPGAAKVLRTRPRWCGRHVPPPLLEG